MIDAKSSSTASDWLAYFETEYLKTFVPLGGSAMKLLVVDDDRTWLCLDSALGEMLARHSVERVDIDAGVVRVDRMEEVFFAVSRAIDWESAIRGVITNLLRKHESLDLIGQPAVEEPLLDWVVDQTGLDRQYLQQATVQLLRDHIWSNMALTRDFRRGAWTLARGVAGGRIGDLETSVIAWLRGELRQLSALRQLQIGSRINRNNSRSFLESTTALLEMGTNNGLALVIDLDHVISGDLRPADGRKYTVNAVLDSYEVLRQFVDSISDMKSLVLIAVAGSGVLDPSQRGRGIVRYQALQARLIGDVADARFANPAAALIQVKGC